MASPVIRRECLHSNNCAQLAIVCCEGCFQVFCERHFLDHRRELENAVRETIRDHSPLQEFVEQQRNKSIHNSLEYQINEWENISITNIQNKANELRQQLNRLTSLHFNDLLQKIQHLKQELERSVELRSFIENDIQNWRTSLENLKTLMLSSSMFNISGLTGNSSFNHVLINILEKDELFEYTSNDTVRIQDYGRVIIHDNSTREVEVRGKNEYTAGCHKIRLYFGQSINRWIFLGINSKLSPLQNNSYAALSACGWTTKNNFWQNGEPTANTSTYIEMAMNDIITLILDCENERIFMINERTNGYYQLDVNMNNCPFPWQLHVNLYDANSSIRILST